MGTSDKILSRFFRDARSASFWRLDDIPPQKLQLRVFISERKFLIHSYEFAG